MQLNGFRNELRDVIVLGNLSGLNPDKNPAEININGAEFILNTIFSKNISGFLNFTYQDARGENLITHIKGKVPGVAKYKGNIGITTHLDDLFTLSITGNWIARANPAAIFCRSSNMRRGGSWKDCGSN